LLKNHKISFRVDDEIIPPDVKILNREIKGFIKIIVEVILVFYKLRLGKRDIKRDLMLNMVTNLIIKDEIYLLFIKLYSDDLANDIYKFSKIIEC